MVKVSRGGMGQRVRNQGSGIRGQLVAVRGQKSEIGGRRRGDRISNCGFEKA